MKIKEERDKLESLLNTSPDNLEKEGSPVPDDIPEEMQQSTMNIDFAKLKKKCEKEAKTMLNNAVGFILTEEILREHEYLKNKLEVDVMSLSGMIYQLRVNEAMQKVMMEEVDRGFIHPRMFEVFGQLSKTIAELNKQLIATVEALKTTYKEIKNDIAEKQTENLSLESGQPTSMLPQGDGGVVTFGTKELIQSMKRQPEKRSEHNVEDVEPLDE